MLIDILTGVLSDGPSGLSIRKFYCLNIHAAMWTPQISHKLHEPE